FVVYIVLRQFLGIIQGFPWTNFMEEILAVGTFLRSLFTDLRLFLFPVDLHFDRSQTMFSSVTDPGFLITIFIWVGLLAWLKNGYQKFSVLIQFCIIWFVIEMFPVSQIVTGIGVGIGVISCADHFLYLASIPIFIILAQIVRILW